MSKLIFTVIGGGSVNWMLKLMRDFYLLDSVSEGEIRLVDPKIHHAEAVAAMLRRFNQERGKAFDISVTTDRRAALRNAQVVLCTFSPGAMAAFYNDLEIPIRYGIRQPVSMTVGPCGLSAALRTCSVAYSIVEDMEAVCPGALLLNLTNPMTAVTRAFNRAARTVRVIGLCHEFHNIGHYIGDCIGLPRPEAMPILEYIYHYLPEQGFDYTIAGINHFIWVTKARLQGRDLIPVIREFARESLRFPGVPGRESISDKRASFAKYTLCDIFGYMPIVGDRHLVEFLPSLCNLRTGWGMEYGVKKTTVTDRLRGKDVNIARIKAIAEGREEIEWVASAEELNSIVDGFMTKKSVTGIMNLPNRGQIENLPSDSIVETLADFTSDGAIQPHPAGELPSAIATLCRTQLDICETIVDASLNGDRELFIQALALDPLTAEANLGEISDLADELLFANRFWLDRFFDEGDPGYADTSEGFSPRG